MEFPNDGHDDDVMDWDGRDQDLMDRIDMLPAWANVSGKECVPKFAVVWAMRAMARARRTYRVERMEKKGDDDGLQRIQDDPA